MGLTDENRGADGRFPRRKGRNIVLERVSQSLDTISVASTCIVRERQLDLAQIGLGIAVATKSLSRDLFFLRVEQRGHRDSPLANSSLRPQPEIIQI